jgi:hypothetical protein
MKLAQSKAELVASDSMALVEDFEERQIKGIGALEVLAVGGLMLPPPSRSRPRSRRSPHPASCC